MRANSAKYLVKQGVVNLWANRMMTLASVGVLTACLIIVGFAVLLTENINGMVNYVESQNEMVVFIYDYDEVAADGVEDSDVVSEAPDESEKADLLRQAQILAIENKLKSISNISKVTYRSREDAMKSYKEQAGDLGETLYDEDHISGDKNILPDSFVVKISQLELLDETIAQIQKITGVQSVSAATDVADTLTDIKGIVNIIGIGIIAALVIVSLVIIFNTIRSTIFTRRKELNIMKYVGATNGFIRLPFIVEGVLLGLISAFIAYLVIWGGYSYVMTNVANTGSAWVKSAFENIIPFSQVALDLALFFVISSVVIGVLGSVLSIRNHIKV